jgi:hypothetical protein
VAQFISVSLPAVQNVCPFTVEKAFAKNRVVASAELLSRQVGMVFIKKGKALDGFSTSHLFGMFLADKEHCE